MTLATLPYLLGFAMQGGSWRFSGFVFGVEDGNSYIAKMLRGAAGDFLFRTPYTAYPQSGVLTYLPYLLLGKLTAPPAQHEQLLALYHLYRFAAGILAILATDDFLAYFLPAREWRRWALVLVTLGGGLGWLVVLLGGPAPGWYNLPLEFYSPESFGFLALYGLPHLAMARALLLWGLLAVLEERPWRAGLLWLLMGFFQPLAIVSAWAIAGAFFGMQILGMLPRPRGIPFPWEQARAALGRAAPPVLLSAPLVGYTVLAFGRDPTMHTWATQNRIASPPPIQYLLAYVLLLPFILHWLAMRKPWRGDTRQEMLLFGWLALFPFLAYAPYNLQRRLPEGIWVALVLAACLGAQEGFARRAFRPLTALALPSTALLLFGGLLSVTHPAAPLFVPEEEAALYETLVGRAAPSDVALSAFESGNVLPVWAPVYVVIGHGPESVNLADLRPRVAAFYAAETPDSARRALLDEFHVRWVVWGPAERALGDADLTQMPFLRLAESRGAYVLFEVGR
ncbi:MAG: hypothetical protein Fur0018_16390 [Anaerolineales bacterium]